MNYLQIVRGNPRRAVAVAVASCGVLLVLVGQVSDVGEPSGGPIALTAPIAVSFTGLGLLILVSIPGHAVGRLMAAAGISAAVAMVALSWTGWTPMAWLGQWSWWPCFGLFFLAILLFPDGHLPSRRWLPLAVLIGASTAVSSVFLALAAVDNPHSLLTHVDVALTERAQRLVMVAGAFGVVAVLSYVAAVVSLFFRWRRAGGDSRLQIACLFVACAFFLLGVCLDAFGLSGASALTAVAVPLGMTIAVLRYHLYDLDLVVNRTLVWSIMTLLVLTGFVAIVWLLRQAAEQITESNASLVATGVVLLTFQPLHHRVQRGVDRLLYGDRDDPYAVVARLSQVLENTVDPTAVLPLLTATVTKSLSVPYVAVEVDEPNGPTVMAEHGRQATTTESFDMVSQGRRVGRLVVATRSPGSHFSRSECRLLQSVASQAAVAVDAIRLTLDLQVSRERLVMAREEERRRLRRDLHDGLGPSLAGMSMKVRAARKVTAPQSRAGGILTALAADLETSTAEVRQLVDALRPPALDRGLEVAMRRECQRFDEGALVVRCEIHGDLEGLSAAVEVAAYRIVAEALTNVVMHSRARTCQVAVGRAEHLTLEVRDDGQGFDSRVTAGVGLSSMADRATQLGGTWKVSSVVGAGTTVTVEIPLKSGAGLGRVRHGSGALRR